METISETPFLVPEKVEDPSDVIQLETEKLKEMVDESSLSEVTTQVETNDVKKAPKRPIIEILFDFVKTEKELNPVLCGYFCKLVNALINSNRKLFNIYAFLQANEVVSSLIKHVYNRSIAELVIKILNQDIIKSDFKSEVVTFFIVNDDSKDHVLCEIIQ